jgi:hypothetical protein
LPKAEKYDKSKITQSDQIKGQRNAISHSEALSRSASVGHRYRNDGACPNVFRTLQFGAHTGDPTNPVYTGLLAQGRDGDLYSTSPKGGTLCSFCGTAFKITPSGTLTDLYNFNYLSGAPIAPFSGLTLVSCPR